MVMGAFFAGDMHDSCLCAALESLLLVLAEDLKGFVDLGLQSFGRLEKVEKFPVIHLQEHTWTSKQREGKVTILGFE